MYAHHVAANCVSGRLIEGAPQLDTLAKVCCGQFTELDEMNEVLSLLKCAHALPPGWMNKMMQCHVRHQVMLVKAVQYFMVPASKARPHLTPVHRFPSARCSLPQRHLVLAVRLGRYKLCWPNGQTTGINIYGANDSKITRVPLNRRLVDLSLKWLDPMPLERKSKRVASKTLCVDNIQLVTARQHDVNMNESSAKSRKPV